METERLNVSETITFTLISEVERQNYRQKLIDEIQKILDELDGMKIYGEKPNYDVLKDLDLLEELEAHRDWLKQRRSFIKWLKRLEEIKKEGMPDLKNKIIALYCDGGVILKNPSPIGGTWAFCAVNTFGERVIENSGVVPATPTRKITNNHSEQVAIIKALEAMPDGWSGTVYSDSQIALGRVFKNWSERNLPRNISMRSKAAVARLGEIRTILLQGHPTKADLACGIGKKRGLPVSEFNVWCDQACGAEAKKYLENLDITEGNAV